MHYYCLHIFHVHDTDDLNSDDKQLNDEQTENKLRTGLSLILYIAI